MVPILSLKISMMIVYQTGEQKENNFATAAPASGPNVDETNVTRFIHIRYSGL